MSAPATRLLSLVLAAELAALSLTGCGAPAAPAARVGAPASTRMEQAAPMAHSAASQPDAPGKQTVTSRERVYSAPSLFAQDYTPAALEASRQLREEPALATAVERELRLQSLKVESGGASWGVIGGGIGAGVIGTGLLGYFVYAGLVGSRDLMYPAKATTTTTPDAFGDAYVPVTFKSHDGLDLKGWYVPAEVPTTKAVVLLHGHTSNKNRAYEKYGHWLNKHYNVFVYDSRFHGESEGPFSTLGHFERKDALKAIEQVKSRGNTRIGLFGESMGGAVAISTGAESPDVLAVWNDCAFDSLQDAVAPRAKARKYPMSSGVAFSVVRTASIRSRARLELSDPIRWVDKLAPRPLYIVHGQKDADTTPMNGDKLFEKAQQPKTIWRTPDARHAESWTLYPVEYERRALEFFDAAL